MIFSISVNRNKQLIGRLELRKSIFRACGIKILKNVDLLQLLASQKLKLFSFLFKTYIFTIHFHPYQNWMNYSYDFCKAKNSQIFRKIFSYKMEIFQNISVTIRIEYAPTRGWFKWLSKLKNHRHQLLIPNFNQTISNFKPSKICAY